ncbi:MAG: hypothetical protein M3Y56_01740 [Armatimonadota bacterium]|nr:hypothetical protein [Armatimonadota bacterium]
MWRSALKVVLGTAAFAAVHSILASRRAKDLAAEAFGPENRNTWYRPFYLAQSFVTFGLLGLYARRLPDRTLWIVPAPLRLVFHIGQGSALVWAVITANEVGILEMLGAAGVAARLAGEQVPPEPEAQGPALAPDGQIKATGPFRLSRHPLNLAPLPVFWLWPRMGVKLLAFNAAATLYLAAGSLHEASRLRQAFGAAYIDYEKRGVPFYLPCPWHKRADDHS